ncbi:hypothetical protein IFM89_010429 [Coptis chinensis]|uniref:DUF4283 domain-containing protein n=1 Tax=Coptis chinensis TaxID=261450 RepID=A0A835HX99_9MAGN|nr:hypothetical protein IFM89_010429 [Coptis chinensis]
MVESSVKATTPNHATLNGNGDGKDRDIILPNEHLVEGTGQRVIENAPGGRGNPTRKSYAAAAAKPKYGRSIDASSLPTPGMQGEYPTICLIEEEVDRGIQYCLKSLVGRLDLVKMDLDKVKALVVDKWAPSGECIVTPLGKGFLMFKFDKEEDYTKVWEQGSWMFDSQVLRLSKWTPNLTTEKESQSHAMVWKNPDKIWVESKKHGVAFARSEAGKTWDYCTHCKGVGHLVTSCRFLKKDLAQTGKTVVAQSLGETEVGNSSQGQGLREKPMTRNQKKKWRKKNRTVNEEAPNSETQTLLVEEQEQRHQEAVRAEVNRSETVVVVEEADRQSQEVSESEGGIRSQDREDLGTASAAEIAEGITLEIIPEVLGRSESQVHRQEMIEGQMELNEVQNIEDGKEKHNMEMDENAGNEQGEVDGTSQHNSPAERNTGPQGNRFQALVEAEKILESGNWGEQMEKEEELAKNKKGYKPMWQVQVLTPPSTRARNSK